jgi:oxygen-dependent protoporphyrinogen oxidase
VIAVPRSAPAAKNRFIYYNGQLNQMPSSLKDLMMNRPPVMKGVISSILREPFVKPTKANDESIHSFVSRRFGKAIAENMLSAIVHGIYAGDIKRLSVRSTFGFLWDYERRHGSVTRGLLASASQATQNAGSTPKDLFIPEARDFIRQIKQSSVYSFKNGLQTLTDAIVADLQNQHQNVKLLTNASASKLDLSSSVKVGN